MWLDVLKNNKPLEITKHSFLGAVLGKGYRPTYGLRELTIEESIRLNYDICGFIFLRRLPSHLVAKAHSLSLPTSIIPTLTSGLLEVESCGAPQPDVLWMWSCSWKGLHVFQETTARGNVTESEIPVPWSGRGTTITCPSWPSLDYQWPPAVKRRETRRRTQECGLNLAPPCWPVVPQLNLLCIDFLMYSIEHKSRDNILVHEPQRPCRDSLTYFPSVLWTTDFGNLWVISCWIALL